MKIKYKLEKKYFIEFCPDKEGTKIKKKKTLHINFKRFEKRIQ